MEVAADTNTASNANNDLVVNIHPLIIASACDHYTRVITGGSKLPATAPVCGLLFGTKSESNGNNSAVKSISICEAADAIYDTSSTNMAVPIDAEIEKCIRLWTAVYNNYELLGWYSFGTEAMPEHMQFHEAVNKYCVSADAVVNTNSNCNNAVFLLFDPNTTSNTAELPITVFKSATIDNNKIFMEIIFQLLISNVEKITLDQLTKLAPSGGKSALEVQNDLITTTLLTLHNKIEVIIKVLEKMKTNEIPLDPSLMRRAVHIIRYLPNSDVSSSGKVNKDIQYSEEAVDSLLVSCLGIITKTTNQLSSINEKQSLLNVEKILNI